MSEIKKEKFCDQRDQVEVSKGFNINNNNKRTHNN